MILWGGGGEIWQKARIWGKGITSQMRAWKQRYHSRQKIPLFSKIPRSSFLQILSPISLKNSLNYSDKAKNISRYNSCQINENLGDMKKGTEYRSTFVEKLLQKIVEVKFKMVNIYNSGAHTYGNAESRVHRSWHSLAVRMRAIESRELDTLIDTWRLRVNACRQ